MAIRFCILHSVVFLACAINAPASAQASPQTDADHYTRYELLAPGSAKFRIVYEVTATTAGATKYFNPIRRGSIATDESVVDRATGQQLKFEVVKGMRLEDGINAARMLLPTCYFDADKCKAGIEALQNYRWDFNQRLDEFKSSPVHDWASHGADAFRYLALGLKALPDSKPLKINTQWVV
jgi:hypothetical protein